MIQPCLPFWPLTTTCPLHTVTDITPFQNRQWCFYLRFFAFAALQPLKALPKVFSWISPSCHSDHSNIRASEKPCVTMQSPPTLHELLIFPSPWLVVLGIRTTTWNYLLFADLLTVCLPLSARATAWDHAEMLLVHCAHVSLKTHLSPQIDLPHPFISARRCSIQTLHNFTTSNRHSYTHLLMQKGINCMG